MMFRTDTEHGNVDALSHLPLPLSADDYERSSDIILLIDNMPEPPCSAKDLCEVTKRDSVLANARSAVRQLAIAAASEVCAFLST